MIAALNFGVMRTIVDLLECARAENEIVETPASVVFTRIAKIRPVRVGAFFFRIQLAINVDKAELEQLCEIAAFSLRVASAFVPIFCVIFEICNAKSLLVKTRRR